MRWSEIETAWHELVDQIVRDWPELAAEHLVAIAGNQSRFISYIASQYELTELEAEEVVDLWLMRASVGDDTGAHRAA